MGLLSVEPSCHILGSMSVNLRVLVPASRPDLNLYKAIVSSRVLGYVSAHATSWGQNLDERAFSKGGPHLVKINETHKDDLVLMLDGYNAWIQLRQQTVIVLNVDTNCRANNRLHLSFGSKSAEQICIHQDIIFGAHNAAGPGARMARLAMLYRSRSLSSDVYRPGTDTDVNNELKPYIKHHQPFLSSGVPMGCNDAMQKMSDQALAQALQVATFGSNQYMFSHILSHTLGDRAHVAEY